MADVNDYGDLEKGEDRKVLKGSDQFEALRDILVGPEKDQIARLKERLDNPEIHTRELSRIVAEAMMLRSSSDSKIAQVLEPTIAQTLKESVKKDPQSLVEAISPIMGPSIRKAIVKTITGMIQSLNQMLEYSFSLQGLKWRIEALRTKKSFAEIVLLNTLVYQVEQVFLIHAPTGLVLQHVVAKEVESKDADMVSGMLTAIQDFVRDSFGSPKEENLDTLRVGDRNVLLHHGPYALLAAVVRGTPPPDFFVLLDDALDAIQLKLGDVLESFDGDASPFETARPHLEDCLQSQFEQKKTKISPLLWVVVGVVVFFLLFWTVYAIQNHQRWSAYMTELRNVPGIIITADESRYGRHYISGLRDPLAPDPSAILQETGLEAEKAVFTWKPYHSLDPAFVLVRARTILDPPDTITLDLRDGTLTANGTASGQWISDAKIVARLIPGVRNFDLDSVVENTPSEIAQVRRMVAERSELIRCEALEKKIESTTIFFREKESVQILSKQATVLDALLVDIEKLFHLARIAGKYVYVEIVGHTDSIGTDSINMLISRKRAQAVFAALSARSLASDGFTTVLSRPHMCASCHTTDSKTLFRNHFSTVGVADTEPLRDEFTENDRESNRCVTFRVILTDSLSEKGVR